MKFRPKTSPNDAAYEPPFNYECGNGHVIGCDRPIDCCPIYIRGERCHGELTRFGKGSKTGAVR